MNICIDPDQTPEEARDTILDALLAHVPFDGWSGAVIQRAAADLGIAPEYIRIAFPDGMTEIIAFFSGRADRDMLAAFEEMGLSNMRVRDRITTAVRTRLEQNAEHKEAIRRALAVLALPRNARLGKKLLWQTVDAMWRAAGDTATDYNHYTKRLILSGVYSTTLIIWLDDQSEDHAETWAFLDRRIGNVMQFEKAKAEWRKNKPNLPSLPRLLGRLRYPAR